MRAMAAGERGSLRWANGLGVALQRLTDSDAPDAARREKSDAAEPAGVWARYAPGGPRLLTHIGVALSEQGIRVGGPRCA